MAQVSAKSNGHVHRIQVLLTGAVTDPAKGVIEYTVRVIETLDHEVVSEFERKGDDAVALLAEADARVQIMLDHHVDALRKVEHLLNGTEE